MKRWLLGIVQFLLWTWPTLQNKVPTCKTIALLNGFFTERKNQVDLGERTTYGCQTGFTTPQGLDRGEIQCLAQGWMPKPECIKTCQKPAEWNEQTITFNTTKSVFFLEEKLVYECKDGYETIKKTTRGQTVCTMSGWNPKPECLPIQCEVSVPEHGSILPRKDLYLHGDVVQFSCPRRFTRVGPASAQCYHFGWSPLPPTCKVQVKPCKPPPNIMDGSITDDVKDEYPHGEQVEYKCNIKFAMTGSKKIECIDGEWTSFPSCTVVEKTCGPPPSIPSGHPISGDGEKYFHGETVTYECEENFVIVGTNPAKCLYGEWKLPVCADDSVKCPRPKLPWNANFVSARPLKRRYDNNDMLSYSCNSNHHNTKCINGEWSPKPECRGLCPPPPQLPNAINVPELRNYKSGDKISIKCREHFLPQGSHEIACEDGKWQTVPRCIDQRCGDPPVIANGDVVNSIPRKYLPGESVEYRCHEGFELRGLNSAVCENMEWSQVPACKAVHSDLTCGEPPAIANADILSGTAAVYITGHQVQYRCHEGFKITGLATVACENGVWSESLKCEDARVKCGHPPPIENGDILDAPMEEYLSGATLQYKCQHFYVMDGSPEVRCVDGLWTATPVCIEACTVTREDMDRSNIQLRWTRNPKLYSESGDVVEFSCQQGYQPDPSSPPFRAQCIEGKVEYPRCIKAL